MAVVARFVFEKVCHLDACRLANFFRRARGVAMEHHAFITILHGKRSRAVIVPRTATLPTVFGFARPCRCTKPGDEFGSIQKPPRFLRRKNSETGSPGCQPRVIAVSTLRTVDVLALERRSGLFTRVLAPYRT